MARRPAVIAIALAIALILGVISYLGLRAPPNTFAVQRASEEHHPARPSSTYNMGALVGRIDRIESRLADIEAHLERVDEGESRTSMPPRSTDSRSLSPEEIIERHREQVFDLIDESRLELAWKDRRKELGAWTASLEGEFNLPPASIQGFLVSKYRPVFDLLWSWRDDPSYDPTEDPEPLQDARRTFLASLRAAYPARLADRLFVVFAYENMGALSELNYPDEMIMRSVERFR